MFAQRVNTNVFSAAHEGSTIHACLNGGGAEDSPTGGAVSPF
jgi:hypothetical protein